MIQNKMIVLGRELSASSESHNNKCGWSEIILFLFDDKRQCDPAVFAFPVNEDQFGYNLPLHLGSFMDNLHFFAFLILSFFGRCDDDPYLDRVSIRKILDADIVFCIYVN